MRRKVVQYWVHDLRYDRYKLECGHIAQGNRHRWVKGTGPVCPKTINCHECDAVKENRNEPSAR